jgi:hypothetical protein
MGEPEAAAAQVARIVLGSPAWKAQATLTLETEAMIASSSPKLQLPKDSPTSLFRSIVDTVIRLPQEVFLRMPYFR